MLIRILAALIVICVLWRWAFDQWPWEALATRSTRQQSLFKARKLLGVEQDATAEQIKAAHKRLIAMVHPDRGGSSDKVHEANAARDLLLSELPNQGAGESIDSDADGAGGDGGGGD